MNDSLGHQVGVGLLIEIAHRLQSVVRDEDTVSRQGGDEFVIVLPLTDAQQAAHVANELQAQVRRICKLEHHELVVTSSIGIAMYPEDESDFERWCSSATQVWWTWWGGRWPTATCPRRYWSWS